MISDNDLKVLEEDFRAFLLSKIIKYNPSNTDMGLIYTSMMRFLNEDMSCWYTSERDAIKNKK